MKSVVPLSNRIERVEEYYFSTKLREVQQMIHRGISVINIGVGSPDLSPPLEVIQSLQAAIQHPSSSRYQPYRGIDKWRKAISYFYERHFHVALDPATEVLPLNGSKEGIMHIAMAFLNAGDNALVPDPGYPTYRNCTLLAGASARSYRLSREGQWQPDIEELDRLADDRTKVMWMNYPHMPTGANGDPAVLESVVEWAKERRVLLVNDNPYSFILNRRPASLMQIPGASEGCLELNTLSKSHAIPGWRMGMLVGNRVYIDAVLRFKSNMDSGQFNPLQEAAADALALYTDDAWYANNNRIYAERRAIIYQLLDDIQFEYEYDMAGLFVWSKISSSFADGEEATEFFLRECYVFVVPGVVYGESGRDYVRWSICSDKATLEEACNRIRTNIKR